MPGQKLTPFACETQSVEWLVIPQMVTYQAAAWAAGVYSGADILSEQGPQSAFATGQWVFQAPRGSRHLFKFFGTGNSNDDACAFLIRKWQSFRRGMPPQPGTATLQWTPQVLLEGSFVLSNKVGVAGGWPLDTHRYADIITVPVALDRTIAPVKATIEGPPTLGLDDDAVSLTIDALGPVMLEVILRRLTVGNVPTSLGVMVGGVSGQ